jgi:uncharacterized protein
MKAALFVSGWTGHTPMDFANWYRDLLENERFEVVIHESLSPLENPKRWQIST